MGQFRLRHISLTSPRPRQLQEVERSGRRLEIHGETACTLHHLTRPYTIWRVAATAAGFVGVAKDGSSSDHVVVVHGHVDQVHLGERGERRGVGSVRREA